MRSVDCDAAGAAGFRQDVDRMLGDFDARIRGILDVDLQEDAVAVLSERRGQKENNKGKRQKNDGNRRRRIKRRDRERCYFLLYGAQHNLRFHERKLEV